MMQRRTPQGFSEKRAKPAPYQFVLDCLEPLSPTTRSMFGNLAVYVGEKIVFLLRYRSNRTEDNGVWVATTPEHHASLRIQLPSLRSICLLGTGVTGWQVIPQDAPTFEEVATIACELVLKRDPRIGKVPGVRRSSSRRVRRRQ